MKPIVDVLNDGGIVVTKTDTLCGILAVIDNKEAIEQDIVL